MLKRFLFAEDRCTEQEPGEPELDPVEAAKSLFNEKAVANMNYVVVDERTTELRMSSQEQYFNTKFEMMDKAMALAILDLAYGHLLSNKDVLEIMFMEGAVAGAGACAKTKDGNASASELRGILGVAYEDFKQKLIHEGVKE